MSQPTLAAVNAALGDVKDAPPRQLGNALLTFSTLVAAGDFLKSEATALGYLASRAEDNSGELPKSEAAAIRRFILQVTASPGRLLASTHTRTSLVTHVCSSTGQLGFILDAADFVSLVVLPGKEQKERASLALEWMLSAATGRHRLDFIGKLCDNVVAVKSSKESSASSAVIEATAIASVGFLLVAVNKSDAQLAMLAHFRDIVNKFSTHALPAARKLVIRLVDCWVERGLGAEATVPVLTSFVVHETDATVASQALDSLSSDGVLDGLSAPALTSVLQIVAAQHSSRHLATVREKSLACLHRLVAKCPFRAALSAPGALDDPAALPPGAVGFLYCLRRILVPACLESLPAAIVAAVPAVGSSAEAGAKNNLQNRLLERCSAILGDPLVPLAIEDLLEAHALATSGGDSSSLVSATALGALVAILDRRGSSARSVVMLAVQVSRRESAEADALAAQGMASHNLTLALSPLRGLIGKLARPRLVELTNMYLSATMGQDAWSSDGGSEAALDPEAVNSTLFCIGASFALDTAPLGECALFHDRGGALGQALLRQCLLHLDRLARGDASLGQDADDDGSFVEPPPLAAPEAETALRLMELLIGAIPRMADASIFTLWLKKSAIFVPPAGCAGRFLCVTSLQVPLMRLAELIPDNQHLALGLFSVFFEEALDDRGDVCYGSSSAKRVVAVCGALSALEAICDHTTTSVSARVVQRLKIAASAAASAPGAPSAATSGDEDEEGDASGAFYLKDLASQQRREAEIQSALEAAVTGDGFLACYRGLLEDLVVDVEAPIPVRGAALRAVGAYCCCSATMARSWSQQLLAIAANDSSPEPLRGVAVQVFGKLGPQASGEELQLAALLRPALSGGDASDEGIEVYVGEKVTAGARPAAAPASVRAAAVEIISRLVAAERIKSRQCLCRVSEALVDSSPLVSNTAEAALRAALNETTGPSLLFEIVFSPEVLEARRVATAKAVLELLRHLKLQDSLSGLSAAVAREVVQHQSAATPIAILGLLPPTAASIAALHGALRRGLFRGAPLPVLNAAQIHLKRCPPGQVPGAVLSACSSGLIAAPTTITTVAPAKRGKKGAKSAASEAAGATHNADVESSLHMLGDLLRCASECNSEQKERAHGDRKQLKTGKLSKPGKGSTLRGAPIDIDSESGGSDLGSDFEDEPKRATPNCLKPLGSGAEVTDALALQRFKRERERPKKPNEWA